MTLKDLKAGYVVEQRNGNLKMVMPYGDGGICIIEYNGVYGRLLDSSYSDDLKAIGWPEFDIIKVYGYTEYAHESLRICTEDRPILWQREERKEMTLAEIEAELGYKIKIVV